MTFDNLLVETRGKVAVITINRPEALNALNSGVMTDLAKALKNIQADPEIGAVVLTGSEKPLPPAPTLKRCRL
jgi:enoyl-CoA hydratase